jgi:hypothetical protein
MSEVPLLMTAQAALVAATNTISDLLPFLVVMIFGFLVGAWGQASRSPIAVIAGMALIVIAVIGFLGANGSGPIPKVLK